MKIIDTWNMKMSQQIVNFEKADKCTQTTKAKNIIILFYIKYFHVSKCLFPYISWLAHLCFFV